MAQIALVTGASSGFGHMVWGPAEAFTPEQLAEMYDINVLGAHRVNRAALPGMREARSGLLVWISSSSVMGGIPPLLVRISRPRRAWTSSR